ncbi:MAG TPA: DUF3299 domain-containing protein [Pirellulales bacterium]|nr:DUF3299 domain-containing protein [Pirellulales bacterium]
MDLAPYVAFAVGWSKRACERRPTVNDVAIGGPDSLLVIALAAVLATSGCGGGNAPAMTADSPQKATTSAASKSQAAPSKAKADESASSPSATAESAQPPEPDPQPRRTRDISFDDLKFDINKGDAFQRSMLTAKIETLDGKPVRIRGFILPSFLQTGLTQFVLVRDNMSCCFGPGAALYDCIIVEMKPGKSTDYSLYPVAVEGIFSVQEMLDPDGKTVAVFHLDGESVR